MPETSPAQPWQERLQVLVIRLLLLVALLVAVFLLAADRSMIPGRLSSLAARHPAAIWAEALRSRLPDLLPLTALVLVILIAHPVYARLRPLAWMIPATAVAAATLLVIEFPRALDRAGAAPVSLWSCLPLVAFLVVLLGKLALLHRHATHAYAQVLGAPPPPLPSQQENLAELCALINDRQLGRVLPIEGRLGEGKSFLIQWLRYNYSDSRPGPARERRSRPVVVVVDVWQQQKESDLQAAILEALFSHPAYLKRLRWLHVPASFLFARWIAALRDVRSRLELRLWGSKADLELDVNVPGLRWQSHFERATGRVARSGRITVIVLDEVDRAAPPVTQAALTLARRSVEVPGVTVLIPYISSFIRYKAFNPLLPVLPDLASSMESILYEERFGPQSIRALGNPADPILGAWGQLRNQAVAQEAGFLTKSSGNGQQPANGDHPLTVALQLGVFATATGPFRDRMQERFEEKYLGAAVLRLRPPLPEDLAAMVIGYEGLKRKVGRLLLPRQPEWAEAVRKAVRTGLANWQESHQELTGPPLRVLEGMLYRIFDETGRAGGTGKLSPADIATLAIVAYDTAGLIHGVDGRSR